MKDPKDPRKIIIDEDVAWIVREIFRLYTEEGFGVRKIAEYLNEKNIITPSVHKKEKFGRSNAKSDPKYEHLWYETSVKRILRNDAYIGTLRCGTTQRTMIKGGRRYTAPEEHIVHENFLPPIISKETFDLAQKMFEQRKNKNVRAKNERIHRYAGLLECGDCGRVFVAKKRSSSQDEYIVYLCSTYYRYGKEFCTTHKIKETDLDLIINEHIMELKEKAKENLKRLDEFIANFKNQKRYYDNMIDKLNLQLFQTKEEIKNYAKQLAKGLIDEETFKELTKEAKQNQERIEEQLLQVQELQVINEQSKEGVIKSVEILEEMLVKGKVSDKDLRLLIDKIIIKDTDELDAYGTPKVSVEIHWAIPFKYHEITPS